MMRIEWRYQALLHCKRPPLKPTRLQPFKKCLGAALHAPTLAAGGGDPSVNWPWRGAAQRRALPSPQQRAMPGETPRR
eukprot:9609803-Lingulodinium_polyedra.AAC.1